MPISKQIMAVTVSLCLVFTVIAEPRIIDSPQQTDPATTNGAPSADDLKSLVAPIALYPDNLVAEILTGATYPSQVVEAERWLQQNKNLQSEQLVAAVDKQPWDPSIKGLTQFPSVLNNMSSNLSWTSSLGDAYFNVPDDVMAAIQSLRGSAESAGNLESNPQQTVINEGDTIVIQPSNPETVYVPTYSPEVYGSYVPESYPGYSGWGVAAASALSFGVGVAVGGAWGGHPWGWGGWGTNWNSGNVTFNRNNYVSRSNTFVNRNTQYSQYRGANNVNRGAVDRQQGGINRQQPGQVNRQPGQGNRPQAGQGNRPATQPSGERLKGTGATAGTVSARERPDAAQTRGYSSGDRSGSTGTRNGTFSGYDQGGAARADSARGQSSINSANRSSGSRSGGGGYSGGGGGSRGGGGGGGGGGRGGGRR